MPVYLDQNSGRFTTTKLSVGAMGDSYYEYLLKFWVMKGRSPADDMYRSMWERAMDEMIEKLVFTSVPDNLTYVAEFDRCSMSGSWFLALCPACLPELKLLFKTKLPDCTFLYVNEWH